MGRQSDARERLVRSAAGLMGDKGYGAVSVQDLCEHADVRKGSFYHFFSSKEDLVIAAIDAFWQDYRARIREAVSGDRPPLEKIRRYLHIHYDLQSKYLLTEGRVMGCPLGNIALELGKDEERIRREIDTVFTRCTAPLEEVLEEAMAAGEIPEGDPKLTADKLFAYVEGVVLLAKAKNDLELIKSLEAGALGLLGIQPAEGGEPDRGRWRRTKSSGSKASSVAK
ncbi:MAG: TetR/AcrR family transcriptional regulator [Acidobacteriota bacterium]